MDDTAPVRPDERFDEDRVAAYLRSALPDLVGEGTILFDQFPGGAANLTYRATVGDTELVLRRAPLGAVADRGHDMAREYRVLSRLWRAYPKAPRAWAFCEDPAVMGKPFFVMERRRGWVVRERWPEPYRDDPSLRRNVAESLVDALADLHAVDPATVGLDDLGHPDGFVERQIAGWARRWEAAATRPVPDMDWIAATLQDRYRPGGPATLLHNDFKLDNAMVGDRGDIVAVFDWDMATRGHPLVDLGTLLAYWVDANSPVYPVFADRAVVLADVMGRNEVIERYADRTGLDLSNIGFYEGLAMYRIAVIIEQIYARYAAGQTKDHRFARWSAVAPAIAAGARHRLRRESP